ncbi:hypothetical protein ABK040_005872 [Willaertia magna]
MQEKLLKILRKTKFIRNSCQQQQFRFYSTEIKSNEAQPSNNNNNTNITNNNNETQTINSQETTLNLEEEERKIKEMENQLKQQQAAMGMIFNTKGLRRFGFRRRDDEEEEEIPNNLTPEEAAAAKVKAFSVAAKALLYGTLINVFAAILFIVICYYGLEIRSTAELKLAIQKLIKGEERVLLEKSKELSDDEKIANFKTLVHKTLHKEEDNNNSTTETTQTTSK